MKIRKKLLGYLTVIGLGLAAFAPSSMMGNTAQAQTPEQTAAAQKATETVTVEQALNEFWVLIDIGLKLIYIVIWPMLFLAGIALDNSMVYGSFFHMDAPLWFFWNMTKNFANFALGFIVLFAILKGIFSSFGDKGKDARNPIEIIKKTLIAGVLIQASWFILAAVVDISTIATYAVGGMPMALLNNKDIKSTQTKIRQTESHLELNNINKLQEDVFRVWYKTNLIGEDGSKTGITVSPCLTQKLGTNTYIVGRKYGDAKFSSQEISKNLPDDMKISDDEEFLTRGICIFGNKPYFFNEFPNIKSRIKTNSEYQSILNANLNAIGNFTDDLANCRFIINLNNENGSEKPTSCQEAINKLRGNLDETTKQFIENNDDLAWLKDGSEESIEADGYLEKITPDTFYSAYGSKAGFSRFSNTLAPTVSQIIDKSKGFVGPFVTIYASIMDFANLSDSNSNTSSIGKNLGNMMIRVAVAAGLVFPLIALAVVLFIRIGFLRAIIATSPLLILANVFKDTIKIDLGKHFTIENILQAIFAPVITVFALSISMIFMTTLSNSLVTDNIDKVNIMQQFGGELKDEGENTHLTLAGFTIIYPKIVDTYAGATGDWFSWILLSFCGIGIMRFILFAAIKASGTIGSVGTKIKDFGENVFKTAPIIPIGGGVGFGTLSETMNVENANKMRENKIGYKQQKEDMETYMTDKFATAKGDEYGTDKTFSENEKSILQSTINGGDSKQIEQVMVDKGFVGKNLSPEERKKRIEELYNESGDFQDIVISNYDNKGIQALLGESVINKGITTIINNELDGTFNSKEELTNKLKNINENKKNIIEKMKNDFTKEITIKEGDETTKIKITKDTNNQLKITS
ncbi:hypothetical protein P148_SR1C00001G0698 [candidate division SR1 bacterium RAAC1_SR1_1]|nr:hypothetical protein P148_SR1C00001G0698 [candidate division SR1 bacterium RAAC1_SR1_1]